MQGKRMTIRSPTDLNATLGVNRRKLLTGAAALTAAAGLTYPRHVFSQSEKGHPLAGKSIRMAILGIAGWLPSKLGVDMSPDFAKYAKARYGYDVSFSFADAPFGQLFQKAATSLATRSAEYNIIISDSQWLGALATPKWIVPLNDIIAKNKELDIEWFAPVVRQAYQTFPDGTENRYGFPQEGDTIALFIRKDLLDAPGEAEAFKARYGMEMPKTWEAFEKLSIEDYAKLAEFFTRPDKGYHGAAMQYSREYDFISCPLLSFMRSQGGDVWDPKSGQVQGIMDTEVNAKAMTQYKAMLKYQPPGAINYGIAEIVDVFTQGKAFSAWQWAAVGKAMIPAAMQGKVMVVPPPGFKQADGSLKRDYIIGGQPWVLNAFNDDAHARVALDFMKWWYLPETQLEFAKRGGNPCDKATLSAAGFDELQPWYRTYKYMLPRSSDFWHDAKYSEMLAVQQEAFTAYATGQISDPVHALAYTACKQQDILFDSGTASKQPTGACSGIRL